MWDYGRMRALRMVTAVLGFIAALAPAAAQERALPTVDLALVLAVDISDSIDPAQYKLQMDGIAQAFEDRDVQNAILSGLHGSIIVALVEWSDVPRTSIGWTPIASPVQAIAFADKVRHLPRRAGKFTCMASALRYVEDRVLPLQPLVAERRIVDVSGDGEENCNPKEPVDAIRTALVEWSDVPRTSIGWTPIASPVQAIAFADKVRHLPRRAGKFTCMASALRYVEDRVLPLQPLVAERRIVDVSGDGEENCNPKEPVDAIRTALVGEGVTINGLAIEGAGPPGSLEQWYRDHVIGGPFSFVLTAQSFEDFPRAIRRKFLVEISFALAGRSPLSGREGVGAADR